MKKTMKLLQRLRFSRPKPENEENQTFDKRLKKVNRARVVNQAGLGGPVFKSRQSESEV
jgi:hypothetical protein